MSRRIVSLICIIVFLFSVFNAGYCEESETMYFRIGLKMPLKSNFQVKLSCEDGIVLGVINDEFTELDVLDGEYYVCRLDTYYKIENSEYIIADDIKDAQIGPIHIEIDAEYGSYEEVKKEVQKLKEQNINAYPVHDGSYKIWIGSFPSIEMANEEVERIADIGVGLHVVTDEEERIVIEDSVGQTVLLFSPESSLYLKAEEVQGKTAVVGVEDYKYRDYITFNIYQNQLIVINYVELNHYLYGVVPREMSFTWPLEALKAQAVAARNYAVVNKNKHSSIGYDLCDTQDCQVYGGYRWEHDITNRAVDETKNQLIKYNGKTIVAYYHSTSGGHTENSENIWSSYVPYLRGVRDEFSTGSPNDNWQIQLKKEEIEQKLKANGIDVGEVISIKPLSYSQYGRVLELMVKGTNGIEILEKEKVRLIFGTSNIKSTWFKVNTDADVHVMSAYSTTPMKSNISELFIINGDGVEITSREYNRRYKVTDGSQFSTVPAAPTVYVFDGKGWGHGLGMSQWGAKRMAELGYNYKQILEYYYTGTKVE